MNNLYVEKPNNAKAKTRNFLIAAYFLITYFEPYLNGVIGSVVKYYMFATIIGLLLFSNRMIVRGYHYVLICWLGYKFLSLLWTTDYTIFKMHYITHLGVIALLVCITAVEDCEHCFLLVRNNLWLGSAVIGLLSLFMSKSYEGEENRQVLTLFGQQNDPNNQAAFLVYGLAISLYFLLYEKKHRLLHIAVICINTYATLLTGSRGGLLSIGMIVLSYIITLYDKETLKSNFCKVIIIAILTLLLAVLIFMLLPEDITERLFDLEGYEDGNNRLGLWTHGLSLLKNPIHLAMGAGWGAYVTGRGALSLHNTFLSILCDVGLLGFCLLFAPIVRATSAMLKKKNILPFSVFVAGMVPSFFIEAINKRFFWNAIMFLFIAYNCHLNTAQDTANQEDKLYTRKHI